VRVKTGQISLAELELELSEIYSKEWSWQIRELEPRKFLVRFPSHKKVSDIKNYPFFNLRKEGVQVEVLEWIGDLNPYAELQEVWIQILGIPPRWCHWKVFAQVASSFGLMVEVDWTTIFKTFYEVVRIKVAYRDKSKIPRERLYEMNKSIFVVSFDVEGENATGPGHSGDNGNGGDDDDKRKDDGTEDEDDDLLDDEKDLNKGQPAEAKEKTPVIKSKQGSVSGARTVNIGIEQDDVWEQEKQLIASMGRRAGELLTATGQDFSKHHTTSNGQDARHIGESKDKGKMHPMEDVPIETRVVRSSPGLNLSGENSMTQLGGFLKGLPATLSCMTPEVLQVYQTPEARVMDPDLVGNKFYQLVNEESNHSKWEEFRQLALADNMNEDCSD
jgi:hypothetical protein